MSKKTIVPPAITTENLEELRRQAEDVNNICHAIADKRNTDRMSEEVVEALNVAADRLHHTDWLSTDEERIRVMRAWCAQLPNLHLVPSHHDPNTADWHWSAIRCFLAGAGYTAHEILVGELCATYTQCPLRADETETEWMAALVEAHRDSGLPACISILPWSALRDLPLIDKDDIGIIDLKWLTAAALLHILKHSRIAGSEVRVIYRGAALFFTRGQDSNAIDAQQRLLAGILPALGMNRYDARKKEFPMASVATARAIKNLAFASLLEARNLTAIPSNVIVGAFTRLVAEPTAGGWFQHGLRLNRAWSANSGKTRAFTGNDSLIMGYAWHLEAPSEAEQMAFDALARAVPATYAIDSPFAILCEYQPNFVIEWAKNADAYASLIDAVLIMSVMRDRIPGARWEFPIMWVLPDSPTPEGSTNQGKTTAVGAIAGAMTPGIPVTRPPDSTSAPDMRVVAGMMKSYGSLALDEWSVPKNQAHPLSARNMQTLATGGVIPMGEVLANNPSPVGLRQPIVASAKCLQIPEDIRNRSIILFQRTLTTAERSDVNRHEAMVNGEVALRLRLAAIGLVEQFQLYNIQPLASDHIRFKYHVALATQLYVLRTGKSGPDALAAITSVAQEMEARFNHHYTDADESGLMAEMESGESLSIRATTIFGTMTLAEVVTLHDILKDTDGGRCTAGQLLLARAKVDQNVHSVRGMLINLLGMAPRANDRALAQAFGRDLRRQMPKQDDVWTLPETLGIDGWKLIRCADSGATLRVRLICTHPASPHFSAPKTP